VTQSDWLRALADHELAALVIELEERAEQFSASTRQAVNDELRRRKMPLIGAGKSRH
jgi:hypothetical protein